MSLQIDFSLIPSNIPSVCIPYVFESIQDQRIMSVFRDLDFGIIEKIEKVGYVAKDGKKVNRVFIHLSWKMDERVDKVRTDLLCKKEISILYDNPWFWKISANRAEKHKPKSQENKMSHNKAILMPSMPSAPLLTAPSLPSAPSLPTAVPLPSAPLLTAPLLTAPSLPNKLSLEVPYTPPTSPISEDDEEVTRPIIKSDFNCQAYLSTFPPIDKLPKKRKNNKKSLK